MPEEQRKWGELTAEEQLALRLAYQAHLDTLPPTCEMGDKVARFADWLVGHNVRFTHDDLSAVRKRPGER